MKNILTFFFTYIFGAILTGCGGGGGGSSANVETPNFRSLTSSEMTQLTTENIKYEPYALPGSLLDLFHRIAPSWQVRASPNPNGREVCHTINNCENDHDLISINQGAGFAQILEVKINTVVIHSSTLVVIAQNGTNYIGIVCEETASDTDDCSFGNLDGTYMQSERIFTLPPMEYKITGAAVFKFNNKLIGKNSLNYRNLYFNEEQVEFQHDINNYISINNGYRRFPNKTAEVLYGRINLAYDNWRFQYTVGDVKSDYYKEEIIDGIAFGWQSDNFTAKAEKPFGGGNEAWLKLFYKREWK